MQAQLNGNASNLTQNKKESSFALLSFVLYRFISCSPPFQHIGLSIHATVYQHHKIIKRPLTQSTDSVTSF